MLIYILRGCSGSGKSTEANRLANNIKDFICSADDYFMKDGVYNFNPGHLSAAHNQCLQKFINLVFNNMTDFNESVIVVDNTNTTWGEIKPYWQIAKVVGATVKFIEFKPETNEDGSISQAYLDVCAARNTHGVPRDGIFRQAARFESIAKHVE